MVSLPSDRTESKNNHYSQPTHIQLDGELGIDTEPIFTLIDGILPFEACLYYQIIPLGLEGSFIKLGMVNPQDSTALDYARRMLAYLKCSFQAQQISSEAHHTMLSAYLSYTNNKPKRSPKPTKSENSPAQRHEQPTLILTSPDNLDLSISDSATVSLTPPTEAHQSLNLDLSISDSEVIPVTAPEKAQPLGSEIPHKLTQPPQKSLVETIAGKLNKADQINHLPVLNLQANYLSSPVEVLRTLSPQQMLEELLARVLIDGIGRLYLDRQEAEGRILWSQNGVLKSILEGMDLSIFQGLINELKRMAHLSLIPVQQPKQVEMERRYQEERLVLSLRVMPSKQGDGEEATLQVLRGAALKFYEQQQLAKLSRDALSLAQQLQRKLSEIRDRTLITPTPLEAIPALNQLLDSLELEIQHLRNMSNLKQPQDS